MYIQHTSLSEDDGAGLEPHSLLELNTVLCQQLGCDATQGTKHCPPGMDELNLPVSVEHQQAEVSQKEKQQGPNVSSKWEGNIMQRGMSASADMTVTKGPG